MNLIIKITSLIAILVIAGSALWYFVHFLPQQAEQRRIVEIKQQDLENEIKCKDAGGKIEKKNEEEMLHYTEIIHYPGRYKFNKSLNACLYRGKFLNSLNLNLIYTEDYVINVYTNETLIRVRNISEQSQIAQEEFDRKNKELGFE